MNIPLNIDWQQILLHLFNFSILAGGLYLLLYRPVRDFMKKREEHYQELDRQAEEARAQAGQLQKEYQARLDALEDELDKRRAAAQAELDKYRTRQVDAAQKEARDILAHAREGAQREHDEILARASHELAGLAVTAAEKLVLQDRGDPYSQFLDLAEKGVDRNERAQ